MITRFAKVLEVDVGVLLSTAAESDGSANIILVDDNNAILSKIDLAFLDIDISEY